MTYTYKDIDDIYYSTAEKWTKRKKTDVMLEMAATIETNLGLESTDQERLAARIQQKHIYETIEKIDPALGELILKTYDGPRDIVEMLEEGNKDIPSAARQ